MKMMHDFIFFCMMYLIGINAIGLVMMGVDKRKARGHRWRIPERDLFAVALVGGSLGAIIGMQVFHHKTKHKKFSVGMPVIFIIQVIAIVSTVALKLKI